MSKLIPARKGYPVAPEFFYVTIKKTSVVICLKLFLPSTYALYSFLLGFDCIRNNIRSPVPFE